MFCARNSAKITSNDFFKTIETLQSQLSRPASSSTSILIAGQATPEKLHQYYKIDFVRKFLEKLFA
jgi:hypothetical protein